MKKVKIFLVSGDNSVFVSKDGSFFGGEIQENEIPISAVKRIMNLSGMNFVEEDIKFFQKIPSVKADNVTYYFLIKNFYGNSNFRKVSSGDIDTLPDETCKILTPFLDGFRSWLLLPDAPNDLLDKIYQEYRSTVIERNQPIALAAIGYTAAGKSSSIAGLARSIGALRIRTDEFRTLVFEAGYNFAVERNDSNSLPPSGADDLVYEFASQRNNLFLDFKAGNNLNMLEKLRDSGYKVVLIHINPPRSWIEEKIQKHPNKHHETFGGPQSIRAMMDDAAEKDDLLLEKIRNSEFNIWREIDPSRMDFQDQINEMQRSLLVEIENL